MKRRALLKLLGLFSAVRGYNIAMVCVAQYFLNNLGEKSSPILTC